MNAFCMNMFYIKNYFILLKLRLHFCTLFGYNAYYCWISDNIYILRDFLLKPNSDFEGFDHRIILKYMKGIDLK